MKICEFLGISLGGSKGRTGPVLASCNTVQTDTHPHRPRLTEADDTRLNQLVAGNHPPAVIVIGGGDEHLLEEIFNRLPTTNILTLEPLPTVARRLMSRPGIARRAQEGRLLVLAGPDYAGATDAWRLFGDVVAMPPIFVEPILAQQHATDVASAKVAAAKVVLGAKQNGEARRKFAGPYLLNTLTNLPVIARESDVRSLFGLMAGVPAVIVAAGPSLDRNLEDLKALAGRVLIVAVDTAVRPLLAAGIRPHLAVSVDPSEVNARHLKDLPDTRDIALVAEGSLYPTALAPFAGRTFTYNVSQHHPWPWLAAQGIERGALQAWGSVITTTLDLVCRMGCNPIAFAGADLAYTRGLLYCRNTTYEAGWSHLTTDEARAEFFKSGYFATQPTIMQRDLQGADTVCTTQFVQFRDWLVARANAAADRRIVNATGGGILHGGRIELASLKTAFSDRTLLDVDLAARLTHAWKNGVTPGVEKSMKRGLEHVLQQRDEQLQRWIAFGKDTVSAEDITERITFAVDALTTAARGQLLHWRERATVHTAGEDAQFQALQQERDAARSARDLALAERDAAREERDQALASRELLQIARDAAMAARDAALIDRDAALAARDAALATHDQALIDRDEARRERDAACAQRDALALKHDALALERDARIGEPEATLAALNAALSAQHAACAARDAALTAQDAAFVARDIALTGQDTARVDRDIALTARDAAITARDAALAQAGAALAERNATQASLHATLVERDAALTRADEALSARDAALAERDDARITRDKALTSRDRLRTLLAAAESARTGR